MLPGLIHDDEAAELNDDIVKKAGAFGRSLEYLPILSEAGSSSELQTVVLEQAAAQAFD